jgi:hypothetical protein
VLEPCVKAPGIKFGMNINHGSNPPRMI